MNPKSLVKKSSMSEEIHKNFNKELQKGPGIKKKFLASPNWVALKLFLVF